MSEERKFKVVKLRDDPRCGRGEPQPMRNAARRPITITWGQNNIEATLWLRAGRR